MFENQNSKTNIDLLSAMRHFYNKAKELKSWILLFSIAIPLIYMAYRYAKNILHIQLDYDIPLLSGGLLWILVMYFLEQVVNKYVVIGARIQEEFDIHLFDLQRNDVLISDNISKESIYDGAKAFQGDRKALENWYGNTNPSSPHDLKVLISQRMNIIWGNELKKKYKTFISFLLVGMAIFAIASALYFNMPFSDSLLFIFFPLIPLLYLALKSLNTLNNQVMKNEVINKKILTDCENLQHIDASKQCRLYQDYIYSENRINSIIIPNWFYNWFKDDTNDKLTATNNTLLKQYSEA